MSKFIHIFSIQTFRPCLDPFLVSSLLPSDEIFKLLLLTSNIRYNAVIWSIFLHFNNISYQSNILFRFEWYGLVWTALQFSVWVLSFFSPSEAAISWNRRRVVLSRDKLGQIIIKFGPKKCMSDLIKGVNFIISLCWLKTTGKFYLRTEYENAFLLTIDKVAKGLLAYFWGYPLH